MTGYSLRFQPTISNSLASIHAKDRGTALLATLACVRPLRGVPGGTASLYINVVVSIFCLVGNDLQSIYSLAENIIASP